jgi:predicted DNA-binding protein (MmcQ/YjbR family)
LLQKAATEDMPFGDGTLVFRVMGKLFALLPLDGTETKINLKCDPERAVALREQFPDQIVAGFHMNKKHWNTVNAEQISSELLRDLVKHSYDLVVATLKKDERAALQNL